MLDYRYKESLCSFIHSHLARLRHDWDKCSRNERFEALMSLDDSLDVSSLNWFGPALSMARRYFQNNGDEDSTTVDPEILDF